MGTPQEYLSTVLPHREAGFRYNPAQISYANSLSTAIAARDGTFHFVEADTGIGKSIAYLLSLADWQGRAEGRKVVIATHSRALQRQLVSDQNRRMLGEYLRWAGLPAADIRIKMGRANYISHRRLAMALDADRLEDVPAQTRRPRVERELAEWALSTEGCLLDIDAADLPEGIVFDDICLTDNEQPPDPLAAHFREANRAAITVVNTALLIQYLAQDAYNIAGSLGQDLRLLIDEAEHFPDVAADTYARRISFSSTARLANRLGYAANARRWAQARDALADPRLANEAMALTPETKAIVEPALKAMARTPHNPDPQTPEASDWKHLREVSMRLLRQMQAGAQDIVLWRSPVKGLPNLVRSDRDAGLCLLAEADSRVTIMTSATLSDQMDNGQKPSFSYMRARLGLVGKNDRRVRVEARHTARDFGELVFRVPKAVLPKPLREREEGFTLAQAFARRAVGEILDGAAGRVLVLCASYEDVSALNRVWPDAARARWLAPPRGTALNDVAEAMPEDGVMVTPAGWEGLSPQRGEGAFWGRVVILRNPTPAIDPVERFMVAESLMERYKRSRAQAARMADGICHAKAHTRTLHKLRQGIGRAIRHPHDRCEILFLDPRFPQPSRLLMAGGQKPGLAAAIPARFMSAYLHLAINDEEERIVI